MRSLVILGFVSVGLLAGCGASDANIYNGLHGQNIVGNEHYVTISNVWNEMDAFPLAEQHCGKHGKSARYKDFKSYRAIFDCV